METQQKIREQQDSLQEYIKGLYEWEQEIKKKDAVLLEKAKSGIKSERTIPPIRGTVPQTDDTKKTHGGQDNLTLANTEKDKGNEFFNKGKYTEAVECYSRSIKLDPTNPIFPANRAMAHIKLQNYSAAEADSSMSITIDPQYVKAYMRRGVARQQMGQYDAAIKDFEHSLRLEPGNKPAAEELTKTKSLRDRKAPTPTPSSSTSSTSSAPSATPSPSPSSIPAATPAPTPTPARVPSPTPTSTSTPALTAAKTTATSPTPTTTNTPTTKPTSITTSASPNGAPAPTTSKKSAAPIAVKVPTSKAALEALVSHMKPSLPTAPPTTSYEFERVWSSISKDCDLVYQYIKMIPPTSIPPVFKDAMTSEIFSSFINTIATRFLESNEGGLAMEVLSCLSKVGRFDMLLMFASSQEKQQIKKLFDELQKLENVDRAAVIELRKKYGS